ncbi:hypothetical protein KO566_12985 [Flavobacteriaceae bacterium XHP0103]|uniref:hypothetical protein n=1 Tax=Marixanthotalea marina TaxID=2844359 RepID=UPI002989D37D|nr:hypothetical protein [Marixanthotalea marina]MBU3822979.1 hypothetical protein [Marixanthotalea marina]
MSAKSKKILKIVTGVIIFLTLPSLLLFGYVFFKYNEDLPNGIPGEKADALAIKMLETLNYEAYKNTSYIAWNFSNRRRYEWHKDQNICDVYWKDYRVTLNLNNLGLSKSYVHSFKVENDMAKELKDKALKHFYNDSFWLTAPYTVFNKDVERKLIDDNSFLVTYNSGGVTPGDSYLWELDANGKPLSFKIWASILPIDGLEATWTDWETTETGALLPTFHKLLVFGMELDIIETY